MLTQREYEAVLRAAEYVEKIKTDPRKGKIGCCSAIDYVCSYVTTRDAILEKFIKFYGGGIGAFYWLPTFYITDQDTRILWLLLFAEANKPKGME